MSKRLRQGAAVFLAAVTFLTGMPIQGVYAAETGTDAEQQSEMLSTEQETAADNETETGNEVKTDNGTETGNEVKTDNGTTAGTETDTPAVVSDETTDLLNYLAVDKAKIAIGETQNIIADIGEGNEPIASAKLQYHRSSDGSTYETEASEINGSGLRFSMLYDREDQSGEYILDAVVYIKQDKEYIITFQEAGMDVRYGVNQDIETRPDAEVVDESEEETSGIVTFDENGNQISQNSIADAIAQEQAAGTGRNRYNGNIVVVLDPGHDGTHGGSSGNGVSEADINLKIALFCREELRQYKGVTVYMTRDSAACPYGGSGVGAGACNEGRVAYAQSVGANVYVSLHNNWASSADASGVEIYYPNQNYNPGISASGSALASNILAQLTALGLHNRGTKIRTCVDQVPEYQYDDGSQADYYAVIRNCKKIGIPAIIVEHAFMSNASDVTNFLGSDAQLKSLGVADATGIARNFGLTKGGQYDAVFNATYYANRYSDLKAAMGNNEAALLNHFITCGMKEGRQGSAEFDVHSYRNAYSDLRMAFGDNLKSYYMHYISSGKSEGRIATGVTTLQNPLTVLNGVDYSAVYDFNYYYNACSDLRSLHGQDEVALLTHFVKYGMAEGRQGKASFDVRSYRNAYSDLRSVFGNNLKNYYMHYINSGKAEGRKTTGVTTMQNPLTVLNGVDYSAVYDFNYYYNACSDLRSLYGQDEVALLSHFVKYGMAEGRQGKASFDVRSYRNAYSDLRMAFGSNLKSYYMHYISSGKTEGRVATGITTLQNPITVLNGINYAAVYDYNYYYNAYGDLRAAFGQDEIALLSHFVNSGMQEGRQASATFNVVIYHNNYVDLQNAFGSNLKSYYMHYINKGKAEGRNAASVVYRSIMSSSSTTVDQMVRYYNSKTVYPLYYNSTDAPAIQDFCQMYYNECAAEGINPAVAFAQSMKETNFLRFGRDVNISQFNFAGLGATGGVPGESFASVQIGIRAHVQHLKAYASTAPLNNACVDTRYKYVNPKGCAPYVEWLGIQENPSGKGWATAKNYGYSIINDYMAKLYTF